MSKMLSLGRIMSIYYKTLSKLGRLLIKYKSQTLFLSQTKEDTSYVTY